MKMTTQFTLLILLAFICQLAAQSTDLVLEKEFTVSAGGLLTVDSDMGSVEVETHRENKVKIRVLRDPDARSKEEAEEMLKNFDVSFSQSGNDVYVRGEFLSERRRRWQNMSVEYRIMVPEKYDARLTTAGGSIEVGDLEGRVDAETAGGSMKFGRIKGPVNGTTAGGSVRLQGCIGKADIRTAGGSITIGDVDGDVEARTAGGSIKIDRAKGTVDAETSGGSIRVEEVMGAINASTSGGSVTAYITEQPKSDCRLTTSAGGVIVYLKDGISLDVDAKAGWGTVISEFNMSDVTKRDDESMLRGKINGGGPELYLRTSSGKIRIERY